MTNVKVSWQQQNDKRRSMQVPKLGVIFETNRTTVKELAGVSKR
jgi:hypothetical protein